MLYIRADGNAEIGMGHVMRCLSVAEAAAELDRMHPPVFITADEGCCSMIQDRGFQVIVLDTDYRDMMCELSQLEMLFSGTGTHQHPGLPTAKEGENVLLVDSYQVSCEYYLALRKFVKAACFEDMGEAYPVDLLINYNIYAPDLIKKYKNPDSESQKMDRYPRQLLLGAQYMPLRKAFQKPTGYTVSNKVTDVIITTGGSDPYFATAAFADALISDRTIAEQGIHLHLISGPFNRFADELKRKYQNQCSSRNTSSSNTPMVTITVHENVKDMRSLLLQSDVVISAAGSTIYEVSSLGVPMIVFYFAENQRQGAEALEKLTDIVNAGCFAKNGEAVADKVREALKRCINDKSYRELLNRQETGLIDGRGARRVAEYLIHLAEETCRDERSGYHACSV